VLVAPRATAAEAGNGHQAEVGGCPERRTTRRRARGKPRYRAGKPAYKTRRRTEKSPRKERFAVKANPRARGQRLEKWGALSPPAESRPQHLSARCDASGEIQQHQAQVQRSEGRFCSRPEPAAPRAGRERKRRAFPFAVSLLWSCLHYLIIVTVFRHGCS